MSAGPSSMRWQFVLGNDVFSRAIAWYGEGYGGFSHVDAIMPDGSLLGARDDSVGGKPPGVQIRPPEYAKWTRRAIVQLPCSAADASLWQGWLRSQIGSPYDKPAILGFLIGKDDHHKGYWICSALQTGALEEVKRIPRLIVPPNQVTPNTLLVVLSALGAQVTLRNA
jgi:hypothetical protein